MQGRPWRLCIEIDMPGTRNITVVLERRQVVAQRYLHGDMQSEIAHALHISQAQVSYDLKAVREMWLASLISDFDAKKAQELAKIDAVEVAAWQGWERSLQPREVSLTEATEGGEVVGEDGTPRLKAPTRKASMRREGQAGDPRFLDGVLKCVAQRCAILGLNAPTKFTIDWDKLTPDQLARLAAGEPPGRVMAEA